MPPAGGMSPSVTDVGSARPTLQNRYTRITVPGSDRHLSTRHARTAPDAGPRRERPGTRAATIRQPAPADQRGYPVRRSPRRSPDAHRRLQAAAARHRRGRDPRLGRLVRPGPGPGGREPRPVPDVQAAQARPPAARRPAQPDPDPVHQHHQPRAGAVVPGRRGAGAPDPQADPLERGRDGPAREQQATRASAAISRPTPARRPCTRSASTTSSAARTTRAAATRSSSRAMRRRASTPARSSRAGSRRSTSTTSGARPAARA